MNIEGTYTLQASPEDVWSLLTDLQIIEQALPGIEQLELIEHNTYSLALQIKQAPLQGIYRGLIKITERQYPSYLCFVIESMGTQNTLSGIGSIYLQKQGQHTVIAYKGTLHVGKRNGRPAPKVIKGAAKLLIQQSFARLSENLRTSSNGHAPEKIFTYQNNRGTLVLPRLGPVTEIQGTTLWQGVARQLHLGADDPVQEEIWGRRVKQASSVAGLLLLLWIGTRLPRRRRAKKARKNS
ncbi:MAG TPA: SRPBCC domain-containing protein [Ktedonobacteraceae bacterium]|jgi:carbon monoxide dehydrogenase subunit G|nr:SRPBCC domain-containing protein [Ktedonobacteraceae bacterium]